MALKLVIAEKPDVARKIAAALGVKKREEGYYEGEEYIITYCIGHLVDLAAPDAYDSKLLTWRREDLPFIPLTFKYEVSEKTKKQFNVIKKLLTREGVSEVINACDAGREGELIFDLVLKKAESNLPVSRLWISSLTLTAISDGFQKLKPGSAYAGLCASAHARQRADWLIGLNATRAQTLVARSQGAEGVYSLGRVQTPTLGLVVDRDRAVESFQPTDYFKVHATFHTPKGEKYKGWWAKLGDNGKLVDRLETADEAATIISRVAGAGQVAVVNKKQVRERSPHLYDLTQLQRAANRAHGLTAARTLEIAQSLYEKQIITYPRTSSQFLTADLRNQVAAHLASLEGTPYGENVAEITAHNWSVKEHHVDDSKVTDHHAIIPTEQRADFGALSDNERALYEMIVRRFLAAFYPDAIDERTQIVTTVNGERFITKGSVEVERGWRAVEPPQSVKAKDDEDSESDAEEASALPDVVEHTSVSVSNVTSEKKQTKAPARFTESMLLAAMETAGKVVVDLNLRAAMKENGLGTTATRAAIIEKLIERQYIVRERKRYLRSTPMGRELINRLRQSVTGASILASAELTGAQEAKLARIERGELSASDFLGEMKSLTAEIVSGIFAQSENRALIRPQDSIPCPKCKSAGRDGFLRARKGEHGQFMACTMPNGVCGYITSVPKNQTQIKALSSKTCPKCNGVLRLRFGKESRKPFLSCTKYPACTGVVWFKTPKKKEKAEIAA